MSSSRCGRKNIFCVSDLENGRIPPQSYAQTVSCPPPTLPWLAVAYRSHGNASRAWIHSLVSRLLEAYERQLGVPHAAVIMSTPEGSIPPVDRYRDYAKVLHDDGEAAVADMFAPLLDPALSLIAAPLPILKSGEFADMFKAGSITISVGDLTTSYALLAKAPANWEAN